MENMKEEAIVKVIDTALNMPGVRVDRNDFLYNQFSKSTYDVNRILSTSPLSAGVSKDELYKIANGCVKFQTTKVTIGSMGVGAVTAIPFIGSALGLTVGATTDIVQFYANVFIIMQKLLYLYGFDTDNLTNDDIRNELILFLGIMSGIVYIEKAIQKICQEVAEGALEKGLASQALSNVSRKLATTVLTKVGLEVTEGNIAKMLSKGIPLFGSILSGVLTYATFKPMSKRLLNFLEEDCKNNIVSVISC